MSDQADGWAGGPEPSKGSSMRAATAGHIRRGPASTAETETSLRRRVVAHRYRRRNPPWRSAHAMLLNASPPRTVGAARSPRAGVGRAQPGEQRGRVGGSMSNLPGGRRASGPAESRTREGQEEHVCGARRRTALAPEGCRGGIFSDGDAERKPCPARPKGRSSLRRCGAEDADRIGGDYRAGLVRKSQS